MDLDNMSRGFSQDLNGQDLYGQDLVGFDERVASNATFKEYPKRYKDFNKKMNSMIDQSNMSDLDDILNPQISHRLQDYMDEVSAVQADISPESDTMSVYAAIDESKEYISSNQQNEFIASEQDGTLIGGKCTDPECRCDECDRANEEVEGYCNVSGEGCGCGCKATSSRPCNRSGGCGCGTGTCRDCRNLYEYDRLYDSVDDKDYGYGYDDSYDIYDIYDENEYKDKDDIEAFGVDFDFQTNPNLVYLLVIIALIALIVYCNYTK